uniref:Golgi associated, gamma adaptin ear containing, ARF binding protein 3a n=1 Tax=Oncorhynchus kisutch TaxID=8019 RepID=A0A8C7CJQ1_ONCKI
MADAEGESLESWLNKATNPSNRQEDWEYIIGFCDQINKELEGPQIAVRLLAHKIQSPQEWEAIQALMVLEACMKNCGKRFHNEVGKFRFLNELIKVVSPKYLGDRVSEVVKKRVVDMLFSWTLSLPNEAKISDAYQMLKKQGIVTVDPELPLDKTLMPSPSSRPKNPVFENEEKSKRLAELLKSKKPEDLQEANRLIKNMVKEDEVRLQRASKRSSTLEEVNNSVKLLNEMLSHFSRDQSTDGDKELIKELYGDCDKLRGTVFKLATETEDNDSSLGDILQASDDLSRVINSYKRIVEGQTVNGEMESGDSLQNNKPPLHLRSHWCIIVFTILDCFTLIFVSFHPWPGTKDSNQSEILVDLAGLDLQSPSPPEHPPLAQHVDFIPADLLYGSAPLQDLQACPAMEDPSPRKPSAALSLLDKELLSLGTAHPSSVCLCDSLYAVGMGGTECRSNVHPSVIIYHSMPGVINTGDLFGMGEAMGTTASPRIGIPASRSSPLPLGILQAAAAAAPTLSPKTQADDSPLLRSLSPILILPLGQASPAKFPEISLSNVHVPLEAIKPSKLCPVTAYDKDGVRVLLHFATDCPPGRPDVLVMVVSMLNTAPLPVMNMVLQAAVPKSMKVRLQPPSGTDLAPFNPIFPPAAITQVMLLANPLMEKVRMRYKLTFTLGEQQCTETGEVDQFPPAEIWGAL